MANAVNMDDLLKDLECSICLSTFVNPKELRCRHVFCKGCLDEMIKFNEYGGGLIECALCKEQTTITNNQTTHDLNSQLYLASMADRLHSNRLERVVRCASGTCENTSSMYCVDCSSFNCKSCELKHTSKYPCHKTERLCCSTDTSLKIECREHKSECKSICCDYRMICIYCMNRRHLGHDFRSIEEHVNLRRYAIEDEIKRLESFPRLQVGRAEENVAKAEMEFRKCLKHRKMRSLYNYVLLLQSEEERLLKEFDVIREKYVKELSMTKTPAVLRGQLRLSDIELALMKENIAATIGNNRFAMIVPSTSVSLGNYTFSSVHPLGQLTSNVEEISFHDANPTLKFDISEVPEEGIRSKLLGSLHGIIQELTPNTGDNEVGKTENDMSTTNFDVAVPHKSLMSTIKESIKSLSTKNRRPTNKVDGSFHYGSSNNYLTSTQDEVFTQYVEAYNPVREYENSRNKFVYLDSLIKNNDLQSVKAIQHSYPSSLNVRKECKTLLHCAARYDNVDAIKLLVEHGVDIDEECGVSGWTVLHYTVHDRSIQAFKYLLEAYPHLIFVRAKRGGTAYDMAAEWNRQEIIQVFYQMLPEEKIRKLDEQWNYYSIRNNLLK